jgi:hypothetical protein
MLVNVKFLYQDARCNDKKINNFFYLLQQYFERVELLSGSQLSQCMCCMELALCI